MGARFRERDWSRWGHDWYGLQTMDRLAAALQSIPYGTVVSTGDGEAVDTCGGERFCRQRDGDYPARAGVGFIVGKQ